MNDEERYADYLEGGTLDDTLDDAARAELDDLRRLFASPSTWDDPPPELADDIVAEIRAEVPDVVPDGGAAPQDVDAPRPHGRGRCRSGARRGARRRARDSRRRRRRVVHARRHGGHTRRERQRDGGVNRLGALDLAHHRWSPARRAGHVLPGLDAERHRLVPIGTFHAREGDGPIELWSGVDVADYPTMTVTIQQEGAGPESSGIVVLRGEIPQP